MGPGRRGPARLLLNGGALCWPPPTGVLPEERDLSPWRARYPSSGRRLFDVLVGPPVRPAPRWDTGPLAREWKPCARQLWRDAATVGGARHRPGVTGGIGTPPSASTAAYRCAWGRERLGDGATSAGWYSRSVSKTGAREHRGTTPEAARVRWGRNTLGMGDQPSVASRRNKFAHGHDG